MKYLKLGSTLLSVVFLNGCLEVENDNAESTVSIKGVVVDALDFDPIDNALITVKVGSNELISNFEVTDGDFELTGLPQSSDIEIVISSPDNQFLSRTFFAETFWGSTQGVSDFGNFAVSEAVDVEISVIDNGTNNAFSALKFTAYSHSTSNLYSNTNSSAYKYQHVSTFDEASGTYTITLPKFIETSISASLDFDKDGEVDYLPELLKHLRGRDLYIGSANTKEFTIIHINEVAMSSDIEIRLSLVDDAAQPLLGATFYIEDSVVDSVYDKLTEQYVISTQIKDSLSLQIPAFSSDGNKYQSSAFTVSKLDDENLSIVKHGSYYNNCCFTIPKTQVVNFALTPQVILESETPLKVVLAAATVNPTDSSFSVFYSQAIEVDAENIFLTNKAGFTVLKGNADENDLIPAGTTLVTGGLSFPVTFALSLNDTRLTVTPLNPLTTADSYHYDIKSVMNKATLEKADIYNDELTFEISANTDEVFSVADIKLDNENFTSNGVAITASNSAGDASSPTNWMDYAYLYLPLNLNSLQKLTLSQTSFVRNGVTSIDLWDIDVVTNGVIKAIDVGIVTLAKNEVLNNQAYYRQVIINSAQLETQKVYRMPTWVNLSDNTANETNSISFEYYLETKTGEVSTGNITIPVQ